MWLVDIEFSRVQTFLFAVPRLADMLGANTLLGETLRYGLYDLAIKTSAKLTKESIPENLPVKPEIKDPLGQHQDPSVDDPLDQHQDPSVKDDPYTTYQNGVLTRDGGHFRALFPCLETAEQFQRDASYLLKRKLPGLRFTLYPARHLSEPSVNPTPQTNNSTPSTSLISLPALQICEESSQGVASYHYQPNKAEQPLRISLAVQQRKDKAKDFRNADSKTTPKDIASLITANLSQLQPHRALPSQFEKLCGQEYLAIIHADGNGIGAWSSRLRDTHPNNTTLEDFLKQEAIGEAFYQAMRVTVRSALQAALEEVFHTPGANDVLPYRILMLGGDDLLLACRAQYALPFVKAYAKALAERPYLPDKVDGIDSHKSMTVGVGVAIAKPNFPFYRLHQIAEQLASSAKRLVRGQKTEPTSVVDWIICTEAWHDNLEITRLAEVVRYQVRDRNETLALSSKPYKVLASKDDDPKTKSLESLLESAQLLATMPRSQRLNLIPELKSGRRHAELSLQMLKRTSPAAWQAIKAASFIDENDQLQLWQHYGKNRYATVYADMAEIIEIAHLKLARQIDSANKEPQTPQTATADSQAKEVS